MTALQLILLNSILAIGCGMLAYFMTHRSNNKPKKTAIKTYH